jgi:hypothetical protein
VSRYFPKTFSPRQGTRKRDTWGLCKHCGHPSRFRCHKCEAWACQDCITLRAQPGRVGAYLARCLYRCRVRMAPEVAERIRKFQRVMKLGR